MMALPTKFSHDKQRNKFVWGVIFAAWTRIKRKLSLIFCAFVTGITQFQCSKIRNSSTSVHSICMVEESEYFLIFTNEEKQNCTLLRKQPKMAMWLYWSKDKEYKNSKLLWPWSKTSTKLAKLRNNVWHQTYLPSSNSDS